MLDRYAPRSDDPPDEQISDGGSTLGNGDWPSGAATLQFGILAASVYPCTVVRLPGSAPVLQDRLPRLDRFVEGPAGTAQRAAVGKSATLLYFVLCPAEAVAGWSVSCFATTSLAGGPTVGSGPRPPQRHGRRHGLGTPSCQPLLRMAGRVSAFPSSALAQIDLGGRRIQPFDCRLLGQLGPIARFATIPTGCAAGRPLCALGPLDGGYGLRWRTQPRPLPTRIRDPIHNHSDQPSQYPQMAAHPLPPPDETPLFQTSLWAALADRELDLAAQADSGRRSASPPCRHPKTGVLAADTDSQLDDPESLLGFQRSKSLS